jgi:hypothetical protein
VAVVSDKLRDLRQELRKRRVIAPSHIIEDAVQEWGRASQGEGHAAFFRLARTLHWAGVTGSDLQQELRDQAAHARSPQKRRSEINGIVKKLDQSGKIGGRKAA